MNHDSSKNQDIKRKFVEREVFSCVTMMTEYILSKGYEDQEAPFCMDDVENLYLPKCPNCGDNEFEKIDNEDEETVYKCTCCNEEYEEEPETEPQEIYEWWMCSDWLIEKLKEHGEPVLIDEGIWGRTCSGQAILLDSVISRICEELKILEGQKNEWKI